MEHNKRVLVGVFRELIDIAWRASRKWTEAPRSGSQFATPLGVSGRELSAVDAAREFAYYAQLEASRMLEAIKGAECRRCHGYGLRPGHLTCRACDGSGRED